MFCQTFRYFALFALCGALSLPIAQAQEDDKQESQERKESVTAKALTVRIPLGKHWIGVFPVPIDESLKAQLNLQDRLIVHHVLPETPAGKAGLQAHDILLRFGDKEIARIEDLVKAVAANEEKEAKLTVLRAGKEVTLTIKPEARPADEKLQSLLPKNKHEEVARWLGPTFKGEHGDTFVWRGVGPGVWSKILNPNTEFPNGLSISISKENDKPAKIVAKRDAKTYETTADKLDILPEEIRSRVERLLKGPQIVAWGPDAKGVEEALRYRLNSEQLQQLKKAAESGDKIDEKHFYTDRDAVQSRRHQIEVRKLEGGSLSDLRKEVEALRKAVEELKGTKEKKDSQQDSKEDKEVKDPSDKDEKADKAS